MPVPASPIHRVFLNPEGNLRNGWKVLLFLVAYAVLSAALSLPVMLLKAAEHSPLWTLPSALAALMASWIFLKIEGLPLRSIGLVLDRRWCLQFGLGTLGGILLMLAVAWTIRAFAGFRWSFLGMSPGALVQSLILYLLVGLHEEVAFRGYPFQRLIQGTGPWTAQILFALLFAWIHWGNPGMAGPTKAWATLNIGLASILLGLAYLKTGSLAAPIGLHLGWNWAQGSLLGFGVSGTAGTGSFWKPLFDPARPEWLTGGAFGLEASLPCALLCGLAILGLAFWKPGKAAASTEPTPPQSPDPFR